MLRCQECRCVSGVAPGWIALLSGDAEEGEEGTVVAYCPPCASREFDFTPFHGSEYI